MKKQDIDVNILAKFLDGNATEEEFAEIVEAMQKDKELLETLIIANKVDMALEAVEEEEAAEDFVVTDFGQNKVPLTLDYGKGKSSILTDVSSILPMASRAAGQKESDMCVIQCELEVLARHGITRTLEQWAKQARNQGWLKDGGVALFNIGRLLEQECFTLIRSFYNTIQKLAKELKEGKDVIVVVDGKEITSDPNAINEQHLEDVILGKSPNHAILVNSIDISGGTIDLYDPSLGNITLPLDRFIDAWDDSSNFMITICPRDMASYVPHPIDLSRVKLPEGLEDLTEAMAENAHEVWAQKRKELGWTYGPKRDDTLKQTPDMVPYSDLSEEEKEFDREMAINTIKLLHKLGYDIVKRKSVLETPISCSEKQ